MKFGIGQSVKRREDRRFVTGQGRFVEDLITDRTLALHIVRSPVARGTLKSVICEAAKASPGVHAVLTGQDYISDGLGGIACSTLFPHLHSNVNTGIFPALATDEVLYTGMAVALVIADDRAAAQEAAELIEIDFDEQEPILTPAAATAAGAPAVRSELPHNVAFDIDLGDAAATQDAIATAAHVTRLSLYNNRLSANSMEMRCGLADYDGREDRLTLHTSTQAPHSIRAAVAAALKLPQHQLRVVAEDVGGGFGMKGGYYPEDILLVWAAKRLQCRVAWIADRSESLLSDYHGRDQWADAELAFDATGKIVAFQLKCDFNTGAYLSPGGGVAPMFAATLATGCYRVPNAHVLSRAIYTNTSPTQPYRGAGRPEAAYLIERLMDQAAREMDLDRIEIRRLNMLRSDEMPYKTPLLYTIDSGDYETILAHALDLAGWDSASERRAQAHDRGKLYGIGLALHMENAGLANDSAEIRFGADGQVTVVAGTFSHGQGHETVYAQMVSEWLGVPFDQIRFVQGDTDKVAFGRGTVASRSMINGGSSLRIAADNIIEKAKALAGHLMEASPADIEFRDGELSVAGTDRTMTIQEIAAMSFRPMFPPDFGIGLSGSGEFLLQGFTFPNGCQVVEVEIDPETGETEIINLVSVDDVGTVINPVLLDGQMVGGIAQGLGQALMEDVVHDETGQMLSGSFMDYAMPRADDIPPITVEVKSTPTQTNPLGAKGAGEAGTVGATPAIISSILDALAPMGVHDIVLPATPHRIWSAIQEKDG